MKVESRAQEAGAAARLATQIRCGLPDESSLALFSSSEGLVIFEMASGECWSLSV
jgi:hypothetical protein